MGLSDVCAVVHAERQGPLLSMLRALPTCCPACCSLMKMDLRQESTRHAEALDEVTRWVSEQQRLQCWHVCCGSVSYAAQWVHAC